MKNLTQLAAENATKKTWIKNGIKNFMAAWAEATEECELVRADTEAYEDQRGQEFTLYTGCAELKSCDNFRDDVSDQEHFSECLSISNLRHVAVILPKLISEIETKLDKRNKKNEELSKKLNDMANALK